MSEFREAQSAAQTVANPTHLNKDLIAEATAQVKSGLPRTWQQMPTTGSEYPRYQDAATNPKFIAQVAQSPEGALRTISLARQVERILQHDTAQHIVMSQRFVGIEFTPLLAARVDPLTDEALLVYEWREGQSAEEGSQEYDRIQAMIPELVRFFDQRGVVANFTADNFLIGTDPTVKRQMLHVIGDGNFALVDFVSKPAVVPTVEAPPPPKKAARKSQKSRPTEVPRERSDFTRAILAAVQAGKQFPELQEVAKSVDPNYKKARLSNALRRIKGMYPDLDVPAGEKKGRQLDTETSDILSAFKSGKSYDVVRAEFGYSDSEEGRRRFTAIANRLRTSEQAKPDGYIIPSGRTKPEETS